MCVYIHIYIYIISCRKMSADWGTDQPAAVSRWGARGRGAARRAARQTAGRRVGKPRSPHRGGSNNHFDNQHFQTFTRSKPKHYMCS